MDELTLPLLRGRDVPEGAGNTPVVTQPFAQQDGAAKDFNRFCVPVLLPQHVTDVVECLRLRERVP